MVRVYENPETLVVLVRLVIDHEVDFRNAALLHGADIDSDVHTPVRLDLNAIRLGAHHVRV